MESGFQCCICKDESQYLYSVRLSLWPDRCLNYHNEKNRNQYEIKRGFICINCINAFLLTDFQIIEVTAFGKVTKWRMSAPYFWQLKAGKMPTKYDFKKWQSYQKSILSRILTNPERPSKRRIYLGKGIKFDY